MKNISREYHEVNIRFVISAERARRLREMCRDEPYADPSLDQQDFLGTRAMADLIVSFHCWIEDQEVRVDNKLVVWHEGYEEPKDEQP